MMRTIFFAGAILAAAIYMAACGGEVANNAPTSNSPKTANNSPASNDVETEKKPEAPTTNDAPTIGPVVSAYFNALRTKDDAALEKVLSAGYLSTLRADMKEEGKTGLAAYLAEYEMGTGKPMEARNEKIDGDKAVADVRGGGYLNWTPLKFVKENGVWKYSGGSPDIDSVKSK